MRTRLGQWLEDRGILNIVTLGMVLFALVLSIIQPGTVAVEAVQDGELHLARRPALVPTLAGVVQLLLVWMLMAQRANRRIFLKALLSFECLMIVSSCVVGQAAHRYNLYSVFGHAFDIEWQLMEFTVDVMIVVPCNIVCGTFDSFLLRRRHRLSLQCIFIANICMRWAATRFDKDNLWMSGDFCVGFLCVRPKALYLACLGQALLFLTKGAVAYIYGQPFAHIRADYRLTQVAIIKEDDIQEDCIDVERPAAPSSASSQGDIVDSKTWEVVQSCASSPSEHGSELLALQREVTILRAALAHVEKGKDAHKLYQTLSL